MTELKPTVYREKGDSPVAITIVILIFSAFCGTATYFLLSVIAHHLEANFLAVISLSTGFATFGVALPAGLRAGRTKARIEIVGNEIVEYNKKGEPVAFEDLRKISTLHAVGSTNWNVYIVTFESGNYVTFNTKFEKDFILQKIIKQRSGLDFGPTLAARTCEITAAIRRPPIAQPVFIQPEPLDNPYVL